MMTTKETVDMQALAQTVIAPAAPQSLSARTAARCLMGVVRMISLTYGDAVMRSTCSDLVQHAPAWDSSLARLPNTDGKVTDAMTMLAVISRGLLPLTGAANLRAALSFWAVEEDPRIWQSVAE